MENKDPNYCAERYMNPKKCKANNCPCVSHILAVPRKCKNCGGDVHYDYAHHGGYCVTCYVDEPSAGLFD